MKVLRTLEGKKHVVYSFESKGEWINKRIQVGGRILFFGTKTDLLSKGDSFWRELVESDKEGELFRCYINRGWYFTAKESGHSAIQDEKEFIIIVIENF